MRAALLASLLLARASCEAAADVEPPPATLTLGEDGASAAGGAGGAAGAAAVVEEADMLDRAKGRKVGASQSPSPRPAFRDPRGPPKRLCCCSGSSAR